MPYPNTIGVFGAYRNPYSTGIVADIGNVSRQLDFPYFFSRTVKSAGLRTFCRAGGNAFAELNFAVFILEHSEICIIENHNQQNKGYKEDKSVKGSE